MSFVGTAVFIALGSLTLFPAPPIVCVENPLVGVGFATRSKVSGPIPEAGTEMKPAPSVTIAVDRTPSARLKPRPRRAKRDADARKSDIVIQGCVFKVSGLIFYDSFVIQM